MQRERTLFPGLIRSLGPVRRVTELVGRTRRKRFGDEGPGGGGQFGGLAARASTSARSPSATRAAPDLTKSSPRSPCCSSRVRGARAGRFVGRSGVWLSMCGTGVAVESCLAANVRLRRGGHGQRGPGRCEEVQQRHATAQMPPAPP